MKIYYLGGSDRFWVQFTDFLIAAILVVVLFVMTFVPDVHCAEIAERAVFLDCFMVTLSKNSGLILELILYSAAVTLVLNSLLCFFYGSTLGMLGFGYCYNKARFVDFFLYFLINRLEFLLGFFGFWVAVFGRSGRNPGERLIKLKPAFTGQKLSDKDILSHG